MPLDISDLRQVGELSNSYLNRRLIRSPKNPMDRCTIVSILPKEIHEVKFTIEPGVFDLEAGTMDKPATLVVGSSSWWKDVDVEQPLLEIPVGSVVIANSVVNDYCNGIVGCNMADAMPGLFFVMGEVTVKKLKEDYNVRLAEAKIKQDNWYKVLVKLADSLWARTNGNPLVIADDMRLAARSLNLNEKPWLKDYQIAELIRCFACGSMRNPLYPVCPSCKAVDQTHPAAKELKFAV
jgi:hypothetical protein